MTMGERWLRLLLVVGVLAVLMRASALAVVVSVMLALIAFSLVWRRLSFRRVSYARRMSETRGFVGETLRIHARLTNAGWLPLFSLHVRDDAPKHFDDLTGSEDPAPAAGADPAPPAPAIAQLRDHTDADRPDLSQLVALRPRSTSTTVFPLRARRRGYYMFEPPTLRAIDLLGLSEEERTEPLRDHILIYPRIFNVEELVLPEKQPLGALTSLRRLIEDPERHMGARDYQPGDPFRQIHWKATAHRGVLQTRVSDHTADPVTMVLLNVTTFEDDWIGADVERFEWAVSVAGSFAQWAHESGATIGLSSNGATPGLPEVLRVKPRRSPDQLTRVLESLATVVPFTAARFEEFLINEQRNVPYGASLLIVSGLVTPRLAAAIHRLHELGKRMVLMSCDRVPPDVGDLPCAMIHLPPRAFADVEEAAAAV